MFMHFLSVLHIFDSTVRVEMEFNIGSDYLELSFMFPKKEWSFFFHVSIF